MMLKVGDKAPSFKLKTDDDREVALKDFKGKTVVLYFYPKDLTSGCTQEACDFNEFSAKRDSVILGVSRDPISQHKKFKEKHALKFALLSDETGEVCENYGVWKQKSMYGRKYMGIERTTFVIGKTGKIEKIFEKVKVTGHAKQVMEGL